MKILLLSFYYPPDLCPGSFRAHALVQAMLETMPPGSDLEIITTMPNRYSRFAADAPAIEVYPGLTIRRIALPGHQSGMLDQSRAFSSYGRMAHQMTAGKKYDVVCATSSRLMTAMLGATVAHRCGGRLYLDIRDIFSDTIKDVLPRRIALFAKPVVELFEGWTIRRADKVNLVSKGFSTYFSKRYPKQHYTFFSNGIDDEFLPSAAEVPLPRGDSSAPVSVVYAGNVGEGQGLHLIIPLLAQRMRGRIHFTVIGDGGRRVALEQAIAELGIDNVTFLPPLKRLDLIDAYSRADVLFVHLNDYDALKKVLPSKLFEYAATGKPIWAGIDGYAAQFVTEEIENAAVFYPCDVVQAEAAFSRLVIEHRARRGFVAKFTRATIVKQMAQDIIALGR